MRRALFAAVWLIATGCSSPPQPEVLSADGRVPINSAGAIKEYGEQNAAETALRRDRTDLQRRLDASERQLAELKAYIITQAAERAAATVPASRAVPDVPVRGDAPKRVHKPDDDQAMAPQRGSIEVRIDAVVFRVYQAYAATAFDPDPALADALLKAAGNANLIVIRGRTDSNYANDVNQRVALARAVQARRYLLARGVDASKIRLYFLSSGDFIADNRTAEGRSRNRRVEVEAKGVNTAGYQGQKVI